MTVIYMTTGCRESNLRQGSEDSYPDRSWDLKLQFHHWTLEYVSNTHFHLKCPCRNTHVYSLYNFLDIMAWMCSYRMHFQALRLVYRNHSYYIHTMTPSAKIQPPTVIHLHRTVGKAACQRTQWQFSLPPEPLPSSFTIFGSTGI